MHARLLLFALLLFACAPAPPPGASPRELVLLHIADLHSHLFADRVTLDQNDAEHGLGRVGATTSVGGVARIASVLEVERARAAVAVTLDAGDVLEGTAVYPLFGGVPEMLVEGMLGVDATAVGNHDLAAGAGRLAKLFRRAPHTALLAANLAAEAPSLAAPSVLVERGGVRVRVIGLGRSPEAAPDVHDCARAAQRIVDKGGADVFVVLSHLGSDLDEQLVPLTTGLDVVLGGHTHDVLSPPAVVDDCAAALAGQRGCHRRPVRVVHSGAYGRYVGRVVLALSTEALSGAAASRVTVTEVRTSLIPITDGVEERADVLDLLAPYRQAMESAGLERPIAFAPAPLSRAAPRGGDSALGNAVTHAMRLASRADVALLNSTGIRDDVAAGVLTVEDVFRVLPFDDRLVTVDVSGRGLNDAIERVRASSCARDRVSQVQLDGAALALSCRGRGSAELQVHGHPVDASATYRVATASFLTGPGQWLESAPDAGSTDSGLLRDVFMSVLSTLPACPSDAAALPCLDTSAGTARDGRIEWE
jgi:5'-nucleotidase/UDP-sugar diphosphatase